MIETASTTGQMTAVTAGLLHNPWTPVAALAVTVLLLVWVARRVRHIARSERPDEALSNLVMVIGLGWSSDVVWEIAHNRLHFPLGLTLLLFFILEGLLTLSMIRAKRHMRDFGWPGRFGTTAWIIASAMSLVALAASRSFPEACLRMVIPLLVVKQWWDGLIGGAKKPATGVSTWRWTPRRLLLAVGAIEPGERDVQTVHRERLTQQMTTLYYRVTHDLDSGRLRERRIAKLARLSLTADDAIITEVRARGDRALWFQSAPHAVTTPVPALTSPAVATPSITAAPPVDPPPITELAVTPETVTVARTEIVPTPADVAARVTPSPTSIPLRPTTTRAGTAGTSKPKPRKTVPTAPVGPLAASATDTPVTAPKPAQLSLPLPVDAALLAKAHEIAEQYRTETGTPITANQLAARLRVNTEQAAQALAVLDLDPNSPTTTVPTVNGTTVTVVR